MPEITEKWSKFSLKSAHRWLACFYITSLTFLAWYIMYEAIIFKHVYRHWQDDRISDPWYFAIEQMCSNSTAICCCDKNWKMSQSSNLNPKTDISCDATIYHFCKSSTFCQPQNCKYRELICIYFERYSVGLAYFLIFPKLATLDMFVTAACSRFLCHDAELIALSRSQSISPCRHQCQQPTSSKRATLWEIKM